VIHNAENVATKGEMVSRIRILPSAARELLYRLTELLEIPFTLTDREGIVIASTAGRPQGQVDPYAISVIQQNSNREITEEELLASPTTTHSGLLTPAPGVYVPIHMDGQVAGVLFARGEPDDVRTKAATAAAAAGLTLEFANGASSSVRDTLGPDIALRALLRGNQRDARRATLMVKVAGWDLLIPRAALVISPAARTGQLPEAGIPVLRELITAIAPHSPSGQLSSTEWVALPPLPRDESAPAVESVAAELVRSLGDQGLPVVVGVGETHIDLPITPGLRRSYREASFCAESARKLDANPGVYTLRSLGPLAFLTPGTNARQRYARQLLEPLRRAPEILETVRVFLDSNLSLESTARNSGQHRHTVRTHLHRARDLTGLDPRLLSDAVQLKLALLLAAPVQTV
jgi:sugar diacid utilization regulator